jgi:uncharacterized membrane protein SirB2
VIELYPQIKLIHIAAVALSGGLFALRGLLLNFGHDWVMARPIRTLSYTIDTVLLAAAVLLMMIIQQYPLVDAWLTTKFLLLITYVVLGVFAFWKARTRMARLCSWLAALAVFGFIVSVARSRDPLGLFAGS